MVFAFLSGAAIGPKGIVNGTDRKTNTDMSLVSLDLHIREIVSDGHHMASEVSTKLDNKQGQNPAIATRHGSLASDLYGGHICRDRHTTMTALVCGGSSPFGLHFLREFFCQPS